MMVVMPPAIGVVMAPMLHLRRTFSRQIGSIGNRLGGRKRFSGLNRRRQRLSGGQRGESCGGGQGEFQEVAFIHPFSP